MKAEDVTASANHDGPDDIQTVTVEGSIYQAADTFEDLKLPASLLQGLYTEMKFQRPSRVQGQTLPMIFAPPFLSLIAQVRLLYDTFVKVLQHQQMLADMTPVTDSACFAGP